LKTLNKGGKMPDDIREVLLEESKRFNQVDWNNIAQLLGGGVPVSEIERVYALWDWHRVTREEIVVD
jgi:hypothetical protein